MTRSWISCFIAKDRSFVRDRPDTCGTCIGQLQRLERLMNNHSRSQRKQKKTLWPIYHQRNWTPLTVNRMTGYPFNIWPLALTIHCVTERGSSRKRSVRLYPAENMTYSIMEKMVLVPYHKYQRMLEAQSVTEILNIEQSRSVFVR